MSPNESKPLPQIFVEFDIMVRHYPRKRSANPDVVLFSFQTVSFSLEPQRTLENIPYSRLRAVNSRYYSPVSRYPHDFSSGSGHFELEIRGQRLELFFDTTRGSSIQTRIMVPNGETTAQLTREAETMGSTDADVKSTSKLKPPNVKAVRLATLVGSGLGVVAVALVRRVAT